MKNDFIIRKLYTSFVLVSVLSSLAATAGFLVDNIIVGQVLGPVQLGAMGIIGPLSLIFSMFGIICSSGGATCAAQAIGRGDIAQLRSIFTVAMLYCLSAGALLTAVGLIFTPQIALLLGARDALYAPSVDYLRGYFLSAIPTITTSALLSFIKIDGSPKLPLVCILLMTAVNIVLDLLMSLVFKMGMFGMALATALSYCAALAAALTHFLKKGINLKLVFPREAGKIMGSIVVTGAPSALNRVCETIKNMILNNLLIAAVGVGAVAAFNVRTQAFTFFGALILGMSQATAPICGMFYGEEDPGALKSTLRSALRIGIPANLAAGILLLLAAPGFVSLLGVQGPEIRGMSIWAVRLFALQMPLMLISTIFMNYYQSTHSTGHAILICMMETLVFPVLLALILIVPAGAMGVWLSFLLADLASILLLVAVVAVHGKKLPRSLDDFMLLRENFGVSEGDKLELSIGNSMDQVMKLSQGIFRFGNGRKISQKNLNKLSLSIEEMAGNIIRHSFRPEEKRWIDLLILDKPDHLLIRLRDNGAAFDPVDYVKTEPAADHIGIRLIFGLADSMEYRRTMGLNVLMITLNKDRIACNNDPADTACAAAQQI